MTQQWSVAFAKEDCKCLNRSSIFDSKYLRTHRAGSIKLIRCFPHCCPTHTYANFCMSSIDLHVSNATIEIHADAAYIRFQPSTQRVYDLGDRIDAAMVFQNTRTQCNVKAEWVIYDAREFRQGTMTYRFNHHNLLGWHYGWVGTSTKAHRTCAHHVVAYIFRKIDEETLEVVGVTKSPPFIVMSYRRACYTCQKHRESENNLNPSICDCEGEFNVNKRKKVSRSKSPSPVGSPVHPLPLKTPSVPMEVMENQIEAVMSLLQKMPANFFAESYDRIADQVITNLLHPLTVRLGLQNAHFPFPCWMRRNPNCRNSATLESLSLVCLDLFLSCMSVNTMQLQSRILQEQAPKLLDRDALHESYTEWLQFHYSFFNQKLAIIHLTMDELSRHIAEANYTELVMKTSNTPANLTGFENFVAQLREVYMGVAEVQHPQVVQSSFNGHWVYQDTLSSVFTAKNYHHDPSIITIVRCVAMTYAFQWVLSPTSLHMRSDLEAHLTPWSELVLDGFPRVFRVFPNGDSSMTTVAGYLHGDYQAHIKDDILTIQLYSWGTTDAISISYKCRVVIPGQQLEILASVIRAPIQRATNQDWATLSASERCTAFRPDTQSTIMEFQLLYKSMPL
ncbi:hypothetical protein THRCLA_00821 [Thraustotheca clavata]|uniref:Uncharacterized protein n=1 Tax=Thraustotheca clavata TaxID=74557 RepID=A0A1W0AAF9_9STRA|nr:hypothetical protein THRCLA_00821 [Thraustotheca clavata]